MKTDPGRFYLHCAADLKFSSTEPGEQEKPLTPDGTPARLSAWLSPGDPAGKARWAWPRVNGTPVFWLPDLMTLCASPHIVSSRPVVPLPDGTVYLKAAAR